jgi:methylglutaconyl-CoA hydratase
MRFSAARAKEIGLVHSVAAAEAMDETVQKYVGELLTASPQAVAAAKRLIPQVAGYSPAAAMNLTATAIAAQRVSDEGQEGLRAFLEKRKPRWTTE